MDSKWHYSGSIVSRTVSGQNDREKRFSLRLPGDVHEELEAIAAEEDRSLNSEMVHALRNHVRSYRSSTRARARRDEHG